MAALLLSGNDRLPRKQGAAVERLDFSPSGETLVAVDGSPTAHR